MWKQPMSADIISLQMSEMVQGFVDFASAALIAAIAAIAAHEQLSCRNV